MSHDRIPLKSKTVNADRRVVETVEELIAIYKREFGENWEEAFKQSASVVVTDDP